DVLLTGSFLGATVNGGGVSFNGGTDTKNSALLAFFGLPANTQFLFGPANVQFNPSYGQNGSFSGTAYSTDVSNTVVPEPGSMMLFGSGLVGLSTLIRRRGACAGGQDQQQSNGRQDQKTLAVGRHRLAPQDFC